jgi:type II secretory pathway pseudopilin PulG
MELIVVIVIVAILAAVMIPLISYVKDAAHRGQGRSAIIAAQQVYYQGREQRVVSAPPPRAPMSTQAQDRSHRSQDALDFPYRRRSWFRVEAEGWPRHRPRSVRHLYPFGPRRFPIRGTRSAAPPPE